MTGKVMNVNRERGYAFIMGEDRKEYFMHRSAIRYGDFEHVERGTPVTFEEVDSPKGLRAEEVYVD